MILIDPNKVDENANEIEKLGRQMRDQMGEVNNKVKSLSADWQDDAQVNYDAAFVRLVELFDNFAELIPEYAAEAHAHADTMRRIGMS